MFQCLLVCIFYIFFSSLNFRTSLILNASDLLTYLLKWSNLTVAFGFEFFSVTVFFPVSMICFTFGGFLDILIMFERLQLFNKRLRGFSKLSARQWSAIFLVICLIIIVPVILARLPVETFALLDNSTNITLYKNDV